MPKTIRFHLDENCHFAIAAGLRRRGVDVTTSPEAGLLRTSDETQAAYALSQGRIIFTQDRDFLRLHAAGLKHPGIVYAEKDTLRIGEIVRGLILIWEIYDPAEMVDKVEYLSPLT